MLEASAALASLLTGTHRARCRVESWYDGELVADDVPISSGTVTLDRYARIPGALEIEVPGLDEWHPRSDPLHPLAAYGQTLAAVRGVQLPGGDTPELLPLGWFRIVEWSPSAGGITVRAESLEVVLDRARLVRPINLGGTLAGALATLAGSLVPLEISEDLVDRAITTRTVEEDRLQGILDLADAWPAEIRTDREGKLVAAPVVDESADPVLTFRDQAGGTVVRAPVVGDTESVYNAVIARGESSGDVAPVEGAAYDLTPSSPTRWGGPFGQVPMFYSSPLLTTVAQCNAAAATRLARVRRKARTVTVEAVPDPRLELGDVIRVQADGIDRRAVVDKLTIPVTPAGGSMTVEAALIGLD
jgi:hypothetical protein